MPNNPIIERVCEEFVEAGAAIEHERWAKWMKYVFSKCYDVKGIGGEPTGDLTIPKELVDRWWHQIARDYKHLSETEKESDRKETRNYLPLLTLALATALKERENEIAKAARELFLKYKKDDDYYEDELFADLLEIITNNYD